MKLTNLSNHPVVLSDGIVLAAAGTSGSSKDVREFNDRDRKRLRGAVSVSEQAAAEKEPEKGPTVSEGVRKPETAGSSKDAGRTARKEASVPEETK